MDLRILAGLLMGVAAIAVGIIALVTAILTRRRRADIADTYAITGGVAYSFVQFGCAGVLMLSGLIVIAVVLLRTR